MDKKIRKREPIERAHRQVVGAAVVAGELCIKIGEGEEGVAGVETLLVLTVAAPLCLGV